MVSIFIRTLLIYILLTIAMKAMGKREIGELDVGELVSTLLISEIAAIYIDADMPLLNAVIPIIFILSLEILFSYGKTKFNLLKRVMESKPVYLISKGKINTTELTESRITLNELLSEIRIQGYASPSQIDYAILEQSGKISLIEKGDEVFEHPIIIDGIWDKDMLENISLTEKELRKWMNKHNIKVSDILLLTVDDNNNINIIKRMEK